MGFTDRGEDIREVGIIDAALEDVFIRFRRFSDGAVVRVCAGQAGPRGVYLPPGHAACIISDPSAAGLGDDFADGIDRFLGDIVLDFVHGKIFFHKKVQQGGGAHYHKAP